VADEPEELAGAAELDFDWPRYPRILVAIDETPASTFALRHVVPYAIDQRSRLTLLSVVPHPPASVAAAGISPRQLTEEMEKKAETRMRQLVAALPEELPVTSIVRHGDPAEEILSLVREEPVDLICMGARGRGRVTGALLGSVSTAVLHHSPVPVVVLHPPLEAEGDG
jgi:nucleotide-binding universal stress UspA family protein